MIDEKVDWLLEDLADEAVSKWGERKQILKCVEELAELSQALMQYHNKIDRLSSLEKVDFISHIQEELADVAITTTQMWQIFGSADSYRDIVTKKLEKLKRALEK